ncbi:MAG: glycosyltransferase [Oscillospiraceae bacterium]|jgi:glycosyltransferase involved in cell wall biosynthesis|nr:glycosyltransferase [Oscillospiraceae bacterium]
MISVIVPIYNAAGFLPACVGSVLGQACADWELLLVDDGSSDGSAELCDRYAGADTRIRAVHQSNAGVSAARNAGLRAAQGEFVTFLDADDTFGSARLQTLAESPESDLLITGFVRCDADGSNCRITYPEVTDKQSLCIYMASHGNCNAAWNKRMKLSLLRAQEIYFNENLGHGEDREFVLRYLIHTQSMFVSPETDYNYRIHAGSITSSPNDDPAKRILRQYSLDLGLFTALGFTETQAETMLRKGAAEECAHEFWRLCSYLPEETAALQLKCLEDSESMHWLCAQSRTIRAAFLGGGKVGLLLALAIGKRRWGLAEWLAKRFV